MTDEEYGRLWAAQNGQPPPGKVCTGKYLWYDPAHHGYPHLHGALAACLDADFYPTEAAAYADLGRAVREIRREIPDVRTDADQLLRGQQHGPQGP